MGKKLASLLLVLALGGAAFGDWIGPVPPSPPGDYADPANWSSGMVPTATDAGVRFARLDGLTAQAKIISSVSGGIKFQMDFGPAILTIHNGGSIGNDGSVEQGKGSVAVVTIMAGGTFNACQKLTGVVGTYKLSSAAASNDVINIYGTLNVKGGLATSDISVGPGNGVGTGTINIYNGGLLDVDAYSINRGVVKMWQGSMMRIKGDVLDQANADITAGKIAGQGITLHAVYMPDYNWTVIPEPATIALLGLGALLLRRKR